MIPSSSDLIKYGQWGFSGFLELLEFLVPKGRLVRTEILRQFPLYYGLQHDIHQGVWPITPNTEEQTRQVSLDDFVVVKRRKRK